MDLGTLMNGTYWGNPPGRWLAAVAAAIGAMGLLWLLGRVAVERFRALSRQTVTDVDDLAAELLAKTKFLFVLLVGLWAGGRVLDLPESVDRWMGELLVVGLLLQAALWTTGALNHLIERYRSREIELDPEAATAMGAMGFVGRVVIWSIFGLLALQNLGVNVTTLVASLGIGGVAVALALQNVLEDLFASLSIVLDKPFVVGDFIIVGDFMGTVEHVGLKTTRVRSLGGEQLVFSNSDLLSSRIRNYKRMQERRVVFTFGVTYDTGSGTLESIPDVVREIVEARENTRFDRSHFKEFGDSALVVETVYYMLVPDFNVYMDTQQEINLELYRRFERHGIEFAFPTRTVHVHRSAADDASPAPDGGTPPRRDDGNVSDHASSGPSPSTLNPTSEGGGS